MTATAPAPAKRLTDLPAHARLWVYKTARDLSHAEQNLVRDRGAAFTSSWAAHGSPLDAVVDVLHNRFVVLAVDEDQALASGCSIDKSVGFIKQLEHDLNLFAYHLPLDAEPRLGNNAQLGARLGLPA